MMTMHRRGRRPSYFWPLAMALGLIVAVTTYVVVTNFIFVTAHDIRVQSDVLTMSAGEVYSIGMNGRNLRLTYRCTDPASAKVSYSVRHGLEEVAKGRGDGACISLSYIVTDEFEGKFTNDNSYEVTVRYEMKLSVGTELEPCGSFVRSVSEMSFRPEPLELLAGFLAAFGGLLYVLGGYSIARSKWVALTCIALGTVLFAIGIFIVRLMF